MNFLRSLLARDESGVDSIVAMASASMLTLCGVTAYQAAAALPSWSPTAFAGAAATIIAAAAAGKTARDRLSQPDAAK